MEGIDLIQDFAILLLAAGLAGSLCKRFGLSVIVGYLIAGVVIGPHTPPFSLIVDEARIVALSQVGLVFLMFSIGLGLSISKFGRLGVGTLAATGIGAFFVLNFTLLLGVPVGWSPLQAMFVAAMLMVSSSAVIAKIIGELNIAHERPSQMALAITVLEDVVAVVMLTLLASQVKPGSGGGMGSLLGGLSAFVVLLVGAGLLFVPRLMRRLEARADPEMQTIVVAGVLFLLALTAAKAGYSIALGAFLFGATVAELPQKIGVEKQFAGLRDMFSSVFFVSIGMMIDLRHLVDVWPLILGITAFALIVRPLACGLALMLMGTEPREARRAGLLLTPLGEFSFIIAQLGISSAVLPKSYYPVAVGASILTVLASPLMGRHREALLKFVDRLEPKVLTKTLAAYHEWLAQLSSKRSRRPIWSLLRGRLVQILIEGLFISGLLIYSGQLFDAVAGTSAVARFERTTLSYLFWGVVGVLVLIPLVAIWRNCSIVAMILAESAEGGRLPRPLVERFLKAVFALALSYWLYVVLPHGQMTRWGWILVAAAAAAIVGVFSSRLIYWHSQIQISVRDVLADTTADRGEMREQARATLGEGLEQWNLGLADCIVPDAAAYAGKSLAELAIPSRFGCALIEVDRNGHVLTTLGADFKVYPGDRILLLGEQAQLKTAKQFLSHESAAAARYDGVDTTVLEIIEATPGMVGKTLAELKVSTLTGVRVVGIQRSEQKIINPSGTQSLEAGDRLLLLGKMEKLRIFRRRFEKQAKASA